MQLSTVFVFFNLGLQSGVGGSSLALIQDCRSHHPGAIGRAP